MDNKRYAMIPEHEVIETAIASLEHERELGQREKEECAENMMRRMADNAVENVLKQLGIEVQPNYELGCAVSAGLNFYYEDGTDRIAVTKGAPLPRVSDRYYIFQLSDIARFLEDTHVDEREEELVERAMAAVEQEQETVADRLARRADETVRVVKAILDLDAYPDYENGWAFIGKYKFCDDDHDGLFVFTGKLPEDWTARYYIYDLASLGRAIKEMESVHNTHGAVTRSVEESLHSIADSLNQIAFEKFL